LRSVSESWRKVNQGIDKMTNVPLVERDDRSSNIVPVIYPNAISSVDFQAELTEIRSVLDLGMISRNRFERAEVYVDMVKVPGKLRRRRRRGIDIVEPRYVFSINKFWLCLTIIQSKIA